MPSPPSHADAHAAAPAGPPPMPRTAPPEWAIEGVIKSVGQVPRALGKMLDALAKQPKGGSVIKVVIGVILLFVNHRYGFGQSNLVRASIDGTLIVLVGLHLFHIFLRLFSSVWFGIILLALIGIYVAIGSGKPEIRASLEMTDLQFFDAWPMRLLLACLVTNLAVVTLRRIPLTLFKLGSWTIHIGIVTLIGGAVWYFWHKEEGSFRIYLHQRVDYCYDVTERALYAYPVKADGTFDVDHPTIIPLPTLPIYYEHLPENRNPVDITLAGLPGKASVHITGYYPSAILQPADYRQAAPDETGVGPGLSVALAIGGDRIPAHWLLASSPAQRVLEGNFAFSVEYLYHPDAQRIKDLQTSFDSSAAITVRIPKLNIDRTYALKDDKPIAVEGSPYTLTPTNVVTMAMASEGYKGSASSILSVEVQRKDADSTFNFRRDCVFRFPEISPDFVNGVRKQAGVDHDIQIVFQDASQTRMWIVQAADDTLSLITRTPDGKSTTQPLAGPVTISHPDLPTGKVTLSVMDRASNTFVVMKPDVIPPEQRPRGQSVMEIMQLSMIDLEVSQGPWTLPHVYVPFSPYAAIGDPPIGRQPAVVKLPDGTQFGLLLATTRRALPTTLTLTDFKAVKYPGAQRAYQDYISQLSAQDPGQSESRALVAHLNNPAADHGLYYFQSAWDGDDNAPAAKRFSVIGVGNRPGMPVMILGASLVILGVGFAFYLKPLLLKAKKDALAKWARPTLGANP